MHPNMGWTNAVGEVSLAPTELADMLNEMDRVKIGARPAGLKEGRGR